MRLRIHRFPIPEAGTSSASSVCRTDAYNLQSIITFYFGVSLVCDLTMLGYVRLDQIKIGQVMLDQVQYFIYLKYAHYILQIMKSHTKLNMYTCKMTSTVDMAHQTAPSLFGFHSFNNNARNQMPIHVLYMNQLK